MAAIEFHNVDLHYPLREHRHVTLKDFVLRGLLGGTVRSKSTIRALTDVSFAIRGGERVGVLGNNGAGKTTLLRAVGGIYPITHGTRHVEGTLCSLLDY